MHDTLCPAWHSFIHAHCVRPFVTDTEYKLQVSDVSGVLFISGAACVSPSSMFCEGFAPALSRFWQPCIRSKMGGQEVRQTLHGWVKLGCEKKKTACVFACRSGEVTFGSALSGTCKHSNGLCWPILCCLLWYLAYCILGCFPDIQCTSSQAVQNQLGFACSVCVSHTISMYSMNVCVWQRGSGALQKLMPGEADKERLDHREAENESSYLGKPHTHTPALHHRCRATHMSHFIGRHQLMSTHEDVEYTSTGTCAYMNVCVDVMVCDSKTLCIYTVT